MTNNNPGCWAKLLQLVGLSPKESAVDVPSMPYRLRDDFLSPAEASFLRSLQAATGDTYLICPKVRLADLFYVTPRQPNQGAFNRIASKHVDFVLCDPSTLTPQLGIELDDSSHQRSDRQAWSRTHESEHIWDARVR